MRKDVTLPLKKIITLELSQNPVRSGQFDILRLQLVSALGCGSSIEGQASAMESHSSPCHLQSPLRGSGNRRYHPHLLMLATAGDTCAAGDEDQGQIRDYRGSQAKCQGTPDRLQSQPINWTVSSLSKGASRDFSMPGHQRGDYNQLSHAAN